MRLHLRGFPALWPSGGGPAAGRSGHFRCATEPVSVAQSGTYADPKWLRGGCKVALRRQRDFPGPQALLYPAVFQPLAKVSNFALKRARRTMCPAGFLVRRMGLQTASTAMLSKVAPCAYELQAGSSEAGAFAKSPKYDNPHNVRIFHRFRPKTGAARAEYRKKTLTLQRISDFRL